MALEIVPAGGSFLRPGGREGSWNIKPGSRAADDFVVSPFAFVAADASEAVSALQELRQSRPDATPLLFGSPHDAGILFERHTAPPTSAAEWLARAHTFDIDQWLAQRREDFEADQDPDEPSPSRGDWPGVATPMTELHVSKDLLKAGSKATCIIGLLPTPDPTEVAAYLSFGGWNDCPDPQVHICLARRWRDRHGAVQVSNTYDSIEFRVAKPISERKEALERWANHVAGAKNTRTSSSSLMSKN